jgi:hypothetical protein
MTKPANDYGRKRFSQAITVATQSTVNTSRPPREALRKILHHGSTGGTIPAHTINLRIWWRS